MTTEPRWRDYPDLKEADLQIDCLTLTCNLWSEKLGGDWQLRAGVDGLDPPVLCSEAIDVELTMDRLKDLAIEGARLWARHVLAQLEGKP